MAVPIDVLSVKRGKRGDFLPKRSSLEEGDVCFITGGQEDTVRQWRLSAQGEVELMRSLPVKTTSVFALTALSTGDVAVVNSDGAIEVWSKGLQGGCPAVLLNLPDKQRVGEAIEVGRKRLLAITHRGEELVMWGMGEGWPMLNRWPCMHTPVLFPRLQLLHSGHVATCDPKDGLRVWDLHSGEQVAQAAQDAAPYQGPHLIARSTLSSGGIVVLAGQQGMSILDPNTLDTLVTLPQVEGWVRGEEVAPGRILADHQETGLCQFDTSTGQAIPDTSLPYACDTYEPRALLPLPGGRLANLGSDIEPSFVVVDLDQKAVVAAVNEWQWDTPAMTPMPCRTRCAAQLYPPALPPALVHRHHIDPRMYLVLSRRQRRGM